MFGDLTKAAKSRETSTEPNNAALQSVAFATIRQKFGDRVDQDGQHVEGLRTVEPTPEDWATCDSTTQKRHLRPQVSLSAVIVCVLHMPCPSTCFVTYQHSFRKSRQAPLPNINKQVQAAGPLS